MKQFEINKNDANQRLDRFVAKTVPLLPDGLLQKYIRIKRIKVNGKGAKRDYRLNLGDSIQLYINDEFFDKPREDNAYLKVFTPKLNILYEDENIILVDKKVGMLCHSAEGFAYDTLIAHLQAHVYQSGSWKPREENSFAPALCNRIDRNTGGIVICAKNAESLRIINEKIKEHELEKSYLCTVIGKPERKSGTIENYLFKDAVKNQVYARKNSCVGSKIAITDYKVLKTQDGLSLVECTLHTGRTHQIRVHMAGLGTPLLGDGKYGVEKINREYKEKGQALYSYKLKFNFKTDGGMLNYLNNQIFSVNNVEFAEKYFNYKISVDN